MCVTRHSTQTTLTGARGAHTHTAWMLLVGTLDFMELRVGEGQASAHAPPSAIEQGEQPRSTRASRQEGGKTHGGSEERRMAHGEAGLRTETLAAARSQERVGGRGGEDAK